MIAAAGGMTIAMTLMMTAAVVEKNDTIAQATTMSVMHGPMIQK